MLQQTTQTGNGQRIIPDGDFIDGEQRQAGTMIFSATGMADEPAISSELVERMLAEEASDRMGPQTIEDAGLLAKQLLPGCEVALQHVHTHFVGSEYGQEKEPYKIHFLTLLRCRHASLPSTVRKDCTFRGDSWKQVIDDAVAAMQAFRGVA